jgi:hypothetical protein
MMKFLTILPVLLIVTAASAQVADKGIAPDAESICPLLPGMKAPDASLRRADGDSVSLSQVLASRPTVLIFYRGGW